MSFEAKEKAVDKLLNDAIYYIPRNQRRYVWTAQNWTDMYDDVLPVFKYYIFIVLRKKFI